ncbi:hypothetical protein Pyn_31395 [Prunus yedoensis var. nudiflora]|uniref:Wall-associated receptor kinase 2-like n=1 Tax=Prunus yedoensis var. nudiflora TaxID=2094558 RepID=A0A314YQE6_PRUYE|nr:hypothetical protein Pyn_31395 [Prunus yedoensis var. nudiflora]
MALLHERMLIEQLSLVILMVAVYVMLGFVITTTVAQALPQALPGCPDKCGNLTIPYPFGIGANCHRVGFPIICNTSTEPPTALWGNITVTAFSLDEAEMQVLQYIARDCYDKQGKKTRNNNPWLCLPPPFTISDTKNKFIAVGCDTYALFKGFRGEERYITGCISFCDSLGSVDQESCSGVGCCQTNIPSGMKNRTVELTSYNNHSDIWGFNPCSYAFIVQEGEFKFSNKTFQQLDKLENVPMILNWAIGVEEDPCDEAQKRQDYVCKGNSTCANPIHRSGYVCKCKKGYEGNPYHPNGCQDIDECSLPNINPCTNGTCSNLPGSHTCSCPTGYTIDSVNGTSCLKNPPTSNNNSLEISVGVIAAFFVLLVVFFCLYCGMKRRQFKKQQDKFFKQNGGLFLRQQLAGYNGSVDAATIFTEEELKKATNNFNEERKIGEGGYGVVYKGNLSADHHKKVVAIKKSKVSGPITETQSLEFANEMIVLSQIHHKNVVRLLGCCLETQTPILVYEYISHGTLHDHIHRKDNKYPRLPLDLRLKTAADTAEALSYLHHYTQPPIIHRDVKAMNILLDQKYTAKVADFGASKLVPDQDEGKLSTLVQGTLGYLDPEYLMSHILTEKSDVYSFGVVLVELITSQKALSSNKNSEVGRNLANVFVRAMKEGCLDEILDAEIAKEGEGFEKVVETVADLANRCLRLRGEERPSMKEVAVELGGLLKIMGKDSDERKADFKRSPQETNQETEYLLGSTANFVVDISVEYDHSMQTQHIQMVKPYGDGR